MNHQLVVRILTTVTMILGVNYIVWRWLFSVNWSAAWISVPLAIVETYSLIDAFLFGATMWRLRERGDPPSPPEGLTVDVFLTTYNEPIDLVMTTAVAARRISYPHKTWILDDGARPAMKRAAQAAGIGYITRSPDWKNLPRHAKAGNLNNALSATQGEFLLILDADQIPEPEILHRMLGHFNNGKVALVQTPQWFSNVTDDDILGSQAPLFYGPIQQGKDGWNAAFFCGSNAIVRREALMQIGITGYVKGVRATVQQALKAADKVVAKARTDHAMTGLHVVGPWRTSALRSAAPARSWPKTVRSRMSPMTSSERLMPPPGASSPWMSPPCRPIWTRSNGCHAVAPTADSSTTTPLTASPGATGHPSEPSLRSAVSSRPWTWTVPTKPSPSCRWPRSP
ncbi:cellulose synthase/poly-beta-1,6-N-acetylglucosamine synthase-like glycosyltransferase [Arthrobacter pascens]|nr:cellulose synthase/poly-beta-1,6-N-acetylglucosamine synthase-like glycosyltransferase [Arthrobacter pascens]